MQEELSVDYPVFQRRFFFEDPVYALHAGERLFIPVGEEGLLFQHAGHAGNLFPPVQLIEEQAVGDEELALGGADAEVGVGGVEAFGHYLVEAVVDRQDEDEGGCAYCHPGHADARNQVDHIV